jgi:MFS transporter, DHA1 family, inner membrane transport protein
MTKKERAIIFLLAALNFTHILDFMIMMPLSNYLMPYFNISPQQFSMLVGAYSLSAVFSGVIFSSVADKYDRKKMLIIVYTGFIIGTLACGIASSYMLLMFARLTAGFFGGIIGGQVFSIISDLFSYERRGMAVGSVMSAFAIASIVGVPVSLYLTNIFQYNWHVPFLLVGGVAILLFPLIFKILPPLQGHIAGTNQDKYRFEALLKVFKNPSQGLALVFTLLMMMGHFLIIPFINPYMEFNRGYGKNQIPIVYLVGGIASLMAAIYIGRISDSVGKFKVFSVSVLLSLVMVFGITNMPDIPFSLVLVFFAVWFVFATGRGVTAQALVTNVVEKEQQGSFMVLNSSMQHAGTFLASIISGFIVIESKSGKIQRFEWVGYLSILVLLACYLLGRSLFRHMDKKNRAIVDPVINPDHS